MPPTRREVEANFKPQAPAVQHDQYWSTLLKSAAVSSEHLTGSQEWDRFLERVQPLLNDAKQSAAMWLERLAGALSESDVRVAQFNYQACKARIETLEEVMALPREIVKLHAEQAIH